MAGANEENHHRRLWKCAVKHVLNAYIYRISFEQFSQTRNETCTENQIVYNINIHKTLYYALSKRIALFSGFATCACAVYAQVVYV